MDQYNVDNPRMMPGETPYTKEELDKLYKTISEVADTVEEWEEYK